MSRILWLVIETVGSLLAVACVLRAYAHRVHLNPRNPISQFVSALTDWLVLPLRRAIPPGRAMDWASVLAAVLLALLTGLLYFVVLGNVSVPNPGSVLLWATISLVRWTVWLAIGLVLVQAILSWVNPYAPLAPAIQQLTAPLLAPIRRVVPAIGGVDLSPLVLILLLQVLLMVFSFDTLPALLR
jgi:YggT family protein